jgi:AraC family transcriptional regulator
MKHSFSLLNADYVQLNDSWNYKNVISPFYRLYLIDNGSGYLSTPEQKIQLEPDFLYLVPSFTLFNQNCEHSLSQYYIHIVEESAGGNSLFFANRKLFKTAASPIDKICLERIIELNPGRDLRKTDNPKIYEKSPVIQEFLGRNKRLRADVLFETEGIILQLLSRFMAPDEFTIAAVKNISSKVPETLNYIGTHLQEKLTVEMLAARAALSTDYFSKLFFHETGERPQAYIQRTRIERAQFLLITTIMPSAVIASETGFEDISHFARMFKKITGHTPGGYRKLHAV